MLPPACFPHIRTTDATRRALAVLLLLVCASPAFAANRCQGEGCVRVRPQDQVFLISSRPVGCCTSPERLEAGLHAEQYADFNGDQSREWRELPWRSVVDDIDAQTPTIIYTHGNRISWGETRRRGLYLYKQLLRRNCDERPVRYVIWSWNSDELDKPLLDYRVKAARTGPVGKQLAWVVNQMPGDARLGLIGFSYGARVTSGALDQLGSGALEGPHRWVRACYIAAAFDANWLGRRSCHGHAMDVTEKLVVTTNQRDPAMRFFHLLSRGHAPQAMGHHGPTCLDRERAQRVRLVNVAARVGRSHDLCDYVHVPGLLPKAYRLLSYADQETVTQ